MSMIISTGVGGGYDIMGRFLSRYLPKQLPGNPTMVPRNMGGAGHVRAANYMAVQAPKDGTTLGVIGSPIAVNQVLGGNGVQYDAAKFNWIGTVQGTNTNLYVWTKIGVKTIEDVKKREVVIGATGAGGGAEIYPAILNNTIGTKFRIILGYGTGADVNVAMERGEVDGRAGNSFSSIATSNPDWLKANSPITFLVQFGLKPEKGFEHVPLLTSLAENDTERSMFKLFSSPSALGWPVLAPPGVPADRVEVLRRAFDKMMKDPEFLAEAKKLRLDPSPATGEYLQQVVAETVATPPDVVVAAKAAINTQGSVKGSVEKSGGGKED
jgi:tripartite-type tricarboxylate transporter receptor subunit TctC